MKLNWFYLFVLLLFVSMIYVSFQFFRGSRSSTVGVTYAKEYKISADKAALVTSVKVISGQQVKAGDLLIELISHALEMEISRLNNKIVSLKSDQQEKSKLADSEVAFIRADEGIALEEINTDIAQAESELKLNRKLTRSFVNTADSVSNDQPIRSKLESLHKQRTRQEEAISIKIKDVMQEYETEQQLLANQIALHQKELALLDEEKTSLNKYASADGVVGNVYVRKGEQVDAFTSLLSINLVHPTTVIGYLVGKKVELPVGSGVNITSYEHSAVESQGEVIGYGAVVELPAILQKSTAVKSFGREVFIEISPLNEFATGEKVLIR